MRRSFVRPQQPHSAATIYVTAVGEPHGKPSNIVLESLRGYRYDMGMRGNDYFDHHSGRTMLSRTSAGIPQRLVSYTQNTVRQSRI